MRLKKDLQILDCWISKNLWLIVIDSQTPGNIRLRISPQDLETIDPKNLRNVSITDIRDNSQIILSNGTVIKYLND